MFFFFWGRNYFDVAKVAIIIHRKPEEKSGDHSYGGLAKFGHKPEIFQKKSQIFYILGYNNENQIIYELPFILFFSSLSFLATENLQKNFFLQSLF